MFGRNTDEEWRRLGESDPYWAVLAFDKYRMVRLTDESRQEFFRSGYEHVDRVLRTIRKCIDPTYSVKRALDFGCGVGRLVIPLSEIAESVTGVDVSEAMLNEARRNCEARSIGNVDLVRADDDLSLVTGTFDLVHSVLVFQHIPVRRGERIFRNLIARTESGGVCVVQFAFATHFARGLVEAIKKAVPLAASAVELLKGRGLAAPHMQMNAHDLSRLLSIVYAAGVREVHAELIEYTGVLGIVMYFRKP